MSHEHPVYDNDGYFVLDPKTKVLKNESEKESIIQFDHNSEEHRFKFPKVIEGHDMSKVDLIQVHFDNTSTGTSASLRTTNRAPINITHTLKPCDDDPEYLTCSWLIGEESTQLAGSLKFKLKFVCYGDDNTPAYKMNTLYYDKYQVLASEDATEGMIDIYQDILLDIERRLAEAENKSITPEQVGEAVRGYFEENPIKFEETDPTVPDWAKQENPPPTTLREFVSRPQDLVDMGENNELVIVKDNSNNRGMYLMRCLRLHDNKCLWYEYDYVPASRTIAGLSLHSDITTSQLQDVLLRECVKADWFEPTSLEEVLTHVIYSGQSPNPISNCDVLEDLTDDISGTSLPKGQYFAVGTSNYDRTTVLCWSYNENVTYKVDVVWPEDGSDVYYVVSSSKDYVDEKLGAIDTALDELHTYAQGLISGGAE